MHHETNEKPLLIAGLFLGIGLGGFFDGILFHQILQLHAMLSNRIYVDSLVNVQVNMFWDGMFHAFTWIMTIIGVSLLWQTAKNPTVSKSSLYLIGAIFIGAGLFNMVEGVIDHLVLQLHHVVQRTTPGMQLFSDIMFLLSGVFLVAMGSWMIKRSHNGLTHAFSTH